MMYIDEILKTMNTELNRIRTCLDSLTEDQVWYRFKPNMNSIGNLCVHLAGNEYQHFISGIGNNPNIRKRTLEFTSERTYLRHELKQMLNETRDQSTAVLRNLTEEDLFRSVKVEYSVEDWHAMKVRNSEEMDPGYTRQIRVVLLEVCEHYGYHSGQIVLLTKLLKDVEESISGFKH